MAAAAIPLILSGISGLAGLFGGGKQKTTTGSETSSQSGTQTSSGFGSTTPELSLLQQLLSNIAGGAAINQYNKGPQDLAGYEAGGLQQINQAGDINKKLSENILAARGLSNSPYAGFASILPEQQRTQQQSQFLAGIPLLQRQFNMENIQQLMNAFGSTGPFGSTSSTGGSTTSNQTGTTNQTGTVSGNPLGGLFGGLGAGLAAGFPSLMQNFGNNPGKGYQWQGPVQP